jgi:hypothetical protein
MKNHLAHLREMQNYVILFNGFFLTAFGGKEKKLQ